MTLNFSSDFTIYANDLGEPVFFQSQTSPGVYYPAATPITALRAQPSEAERMPTAGVYAGFDLDWLLRGSTVIAPPKPGDQVIDGQENVWTILTVNFDQLDQVYQAHCVNLVLAYGLRDSVDIQRATISYDAAGGLVRAWPDHNVGGVSVGGSTPYQAVSCRAQLIDQAEKEERAMRGQQGDYQIVVGQQVTLTAEDRLKVTLAAGGTVLYLLVKSQKQPNRIDELPILDAVLAI